MKIPKNFYLVMAVLGSVIPWFFFANFIAQEGVNIPLFLQSWFVNSASSGVAADLLISAFVFWVWAGVDAQKKQIRNWWLIFPATILVGLSLALPLYLYLREE